MTLASIAQDVVFLVLVSALVPPAGAYMARVFSGQRTWLDPVLLVGHLARVPV
jgi:K+-transporting ATPase ATPase A chain